MTEAKYLWQGKGIEEWAEIWAQERSREKEMLVYYDEVNGEITQKALAEKFDLKPARVSLLVRRHVEQLKVDELIQAITIVRKYLQEIFDQKMEIDLTMSSIFDATNKALEKVNRLNDKRWLR